MAAEVLALPLLAERLPLPPPAGLDPLLDAAAVCLARHGLSKTSLRDIAREMGVAPSTVSRKVGSVEHVALLVIAREGQRFLARLPEVIGGETGPRAVTRVVVAAVEHARAHPVAAKVLRDEDIWMGRVVTRRLDALLDQGVEVSRPILAAAMDAGMIRRQDPALLAHWLLRISLSAVVAPPPGDLATAIDSLLLPLLAPPPRAPPIPPP
ncbi:MAG: TetR/AcrR family transcriptional regulator, partial [Actinomycetota bacterium]